MPVEDAGVQQQLFERDLPAVAAHEHEAEGPRHEVIHADPRCPVEHAVRAEQDLLQRQAHVAAIGKHGAVAQNAAGRLLTAADADIGKRGIQRVRCKGQQGNDAHGAQHGAVKLAAERLDDGAGTIFSAKAERWEMLRSLKMRIFPHRNPTASRTTRMRTCSPVDRILPSIESLLSARWSHHSREFG